MCKQLKSQSGFTLVEFVFVIVVLSILTVSAVVTFIDLREDAARANLTTVHGGFLSATQLVHAAWQAQGNPASINIMGNAVAVTAAGYPGAAFMNNASCQTLWNNILMTAPTVNSIFITNSNNYYALGFFNFCFYILQDDGSPLRWFRYDANNGTFLVNNP